MQGPRSAALGAAAMVALGLVGCGQNHSTASSSAPLTTSVTTAAARSGALPSGDTLADVLYRISDPAVAGTAKLNLVEDATAGDATTLDKFATALKDNGYDPPTFTATDIAWSDARPEDVVATITVTKPGNTGDGGSFPMEFAPAKDGWQLSQETLTMLLDFSGTPTGTSSISPTPTG